MVKEIKNKKLYNINKAKMMIASAIAIGSVAGIPVFNDVEKVEAAEIYLWEKYNSNYKPTFSYDKSKPVKQPSQKVIHLGTVYGSYTQTSSGFQLSDPVAKTNGGNTLTKTMGSTVYTGGGNSMTEHYIHFYSSGNTSTDLIGFTETVHTLTPTGGVYSKGSLVGTVQGEKNAYVDDQRNSDGFWYVRKELVNRPPTTPTLTIPAQQFEHGDKHVIGWNGSDPDGDSLTYTLQAAYNGSNTWETLYTGANKTFNYTVPNNKTSVQFRVTASDGKLSTTSAVSTSKSIREVMYYWSKFNNEKVGDYNKPESWNWTSKGHLGIPEDNRFGIGFTELQYNESTKDFTKKGKLDYIEDMPIGTISYNTRLDPGSKVFDIAIRYVKTSQWKVEIYEARPENVKNKDGKGSLIKNNIQAGFNKYQHGVKNSDGFWYERGQRVLSEDVTPPIIELVEQKSYGKTSTISVKTHDLGVVSTVKWATGKQSEAYFGSNGTSIATGQNTSSNFTVSKNGIYTVYAVDAKGNKAVQTIEIKNVNLPAEIQSISTAQFNIADNTTSITLNGTYSDREGNDVIATVTANGQNSGTGSGTGSSFNAIANATNLIEGVHENPYSITLNDGIENSTSVKTTDHIVVKVANAADYTTDFEAHLQDGGIDGDTLSKAQHEEFYNAYVAVQAYEKGRTTAQYDAAVNAINTVKSSIGITESTTIENWNERLAVVLTTVALEKAESTLVKVDYEQALALQEALTLQSNKDLLQARFDEMKNYHIADGLLLPMTTLIGDQTAFFAFVDWDKINEARTSITKVKNTTNKGNLNQRLVEIIDYFLNHKPNLSGEDLIEGGVEIPGIDIDDEYFNRIYNDLKDAFEPLVINGDLTNSQQLVYVSIALRQVMMNLDQTSVDKYKAAVNTALATGTGIDGAKLQTVTNTVDALYNHRINFVENDSEILKTTATIGALTTGKTYVSDYFTKMNQVIKEVTEYNTVDFDEAHNDLEKAEGEAAVAVLWANSRFQEQMSDYLNNGIPDFHIDSDKYEYIHDADLTIKGNITDTNHSGHTVKLDIAGITANQSVGNDGQFNLTVTMPMGINRDDIRLTANDGLTDKKMTVTGKPIIKVANADLYIEMLKLLETDRNEDLTIMTDATLNSLIDIAETIVTFDIHSSPLLTQGLLTKAEQLSTQQEGLLETFIRDYLQANYLEWLFNNYLTATVDEFVFAGVVLNGQKVVTYGNIDDMRQVITDYKSSFVSPDVPTVPQVADYIKWADMLTKFDELNVKIDSIYDLTDLKEVEIAISEVTNLVDVTIPVWSSVRPSYTSKLEDVNDFKNALTGVIEAEKTLKQDDLDAAQTLVDLVDDVDANAALQGRIDALQNILDAIKNAADAVTKAEVELANGTNESTEIALDLAQSLVDQVEEGPEKDRLQDRLNEVENVLDARNAVKKAEDEVMNLSVDDAQLNVDNAKLLVDLILNQVEKDLLSKRLDEVQNIINAKEAIDQAAQAIVDEDETLIEQRMNAAQNKIDAVDTPAAKEELQGLLDNLDLLANVIQAVIAAERIEEQTTKDTAQVLVDALPLSPTTDQLKHRLDEVQKVIDGKVAVDLAESTLTRDDYNDAVTVVNNISDSKATKIELQKRLDNLLLLIEAIEAVEGAEDSLNQKDKDDAKDLVDALPDGDKKDELLDRLDDVQDAIDKKSEAAKAEDAVKKAEDSWNQSDLDEAKNLVDNLPDGTVKKELQDRLDTVKDLIDAYEKAKDAVGKAENDKTVTNVSDAQKAIDDLVNLAGGPNDKTQELQDRLDKVNDYIEAEKAVTRAENLLTQGSKDSAQQKVDKLEPGADKDALQERLDKIQELIDAKDGNDLLDKIIDDPNSVTGEELAEYVQPEPIYEEILDEYKDGLKDLVDNNDNISKEDVVQVIRFINSLEVAKRSMFATDIQTYATEYELAKNLLTIDNYPTPVFLEKIEQYVSDDTALNDLVSIISSEAKISEAAVLEAIANMQKVKVDIQVGSYSIQYIDANGDLVQKDTFTNVEYGEVVLEPSLEGYEIVNSETDVHSFKMSEETDGSEFTFIVKPKDVEVQVGTYSIKYVNETGDIVQKDTFTNVDYGEVVLTPSLEGYEIISDGTEVYSFEMNEETDGNEFTFIVKQNIEEEVNVGTYIIEYKDVDGNVLYSEEFTDVPFGKVTALASIENLQNYLAANNFVGNFELSSDSEEEQIFDLTAESTGKVITFTVKLISPEETPPTVEDGEETEEIPSVEEEDEVIVETPPVVEDGEEIKELPSVEEEDEVNVETPPVVEDGEETEELPSVDEKDEDIEETQPVVVDNESTEGNNLVQAAYQTIKVASLDNLGLYLTSTSNVFDDGLNISNEHASYLTKSFLSLEGVKTVIGLGTSVQDEYVEQVKMYIVQNLLDGAYKEMLLAKLNIDINDIGNGDDGIPDLTPIEPVKPEQPTEPVEPPTSPTDPIQPPTNPIEPVEPPKSNGGGNGSGKNDGKSEDKEVISPTPPLPPITDPGKGKDNSIFEEHKDNELNWTLKNPSGDEYVFKANGINITIPLKQFENAKLLNLSWIHLGSEHYKLVVKVDGKQVITFKDAVKFEKTHDFAYLVRSVDGEYTAMPYKYQEEKFNFKTKTLKSDFYFSTNTKSFEDINGLYSESEIEELASRYIVLGKTPTTYVPSNYMTRAEFSSMISRALGLAEMETGGVTIASNNAESLQVTIAPSFVDTQNHWATIDIQMLHKTGVVQGVTEERFDPNGEITRKQAALMIYRLLEGQGIDMPKANPTFNDNSSLIGDMELYRAVGSLQQLQIFEGENNLFMGDEKLTRAQMAKVLDRALQKTDSY